MKRVCWCLVLMMIVLFTAYVLLMARFEDPIRLDLTDRVQLSVEDQTIKLPWYLSIGITYDCRFDDADMAGREYTKFVYGLPEAFESTELNCIVCWETKQVIAFVGESRAMFVIDEEFSELQWS